MVKGVNKTVIEVNNTGSKLFEKIVFYVTPEYGNLSAKQLRRAASSFSFNYEAPANSKTLRKRYKQKRQKRIILCSVLALAVLSLILALIL